MPYGPSNMISRLKSGSMWSMLSIRSVMPWEWSRFSSTLMSPNCRFRSTSATFRLVSFAMDGHDDARRPRGFLGQHLGRLDAVHDRHIDVHEDDVRHDLLGLLDAFFAIDGGGDHLDVGLEREQLLEVIQGAGDVVHDQDFDWLAHLVISLKEGTPRNLPISRGACQRFFLTGLLDVVGVVEGVDVRDAGGHLGNRVVLYRPEHVLVVGVVEQPLEFLSLLERDDHGEARGDATRVGATRGPNPDDLQVGKGGLGLGLLARVRRVRGMADEGVDPG